MSASVWKTVRVIVSVPVRADVLNERSFAGLVRDALEDNVKFWRRIADVRIGRPVVLEHARSTAAQKRRNPDEISEIQKILTNLSVRISNLETSTAPAEHRD